MFRLYQKLRIIGALALVAMAGGNTLAQHRLNSDSGRRMPRTQQLPDPLALREFDQRSNEMNAIPSDDGDRPFDQTNSVQQIRELSKRAIGDYKTIDAVFLQCYFETLPTLLQAGDDAIPPAPDETEWSSLSDTSQLEPNPSPGNFCEPVFNHVASNDCCYGVQNWSPLLRRLGVDATGCEEPGIGHERVMFAPFEIDPTQPTNYWLVRYDSGFGLRTPDRAEYFWSKPGKGPAMSRDQINFQDLRFINETGSDSFSVITEIPVRFIDADSLHSTSGIGDMKVATKLRLINGQKWQVTQILRTYINTGSARKGVGAGHLSLEPGLLARDDAIPPAPDETGWPSLSDTSPLEPNPSPGNFCEPVFNHVVSNDCCYGVQNWSPLLRRLGVDATGCEEPGIGHERVMFAPFEIDPTQPTNYWLVRYDSGFGLRTPDRAEYFWSKPGKGPAMSRDQINFQDLRFINETGSDSFSVITEIPVRFIDADSLHSTSGIGDMKVATKLRLINGQKWQVTQILRTYINTGSARKGVGAGHLSLEPGLLARYELSPDTYLHSECKLWVPIAGDPVFSGNVLRSGLGISHVLYETDRFAIIPNLEMVNFTYLTGQKTVGTRSPRVNGEAAINLMPGARFVFGPKGDLGLFELGVSGLVGLGDEYVNQMFRVDFKLSY